MSLNDTPACFLEGPETNVVVVLLSLSWHVAIRRLGEADGRLSLTLPDPRRGIPPIDGTFVNEPRP